ncbi:MAG: YeeE/YedE family protein [Methyloprofundus sp.]|nr:YeeE/YedE family protein [Methyloprofundus sp.]
MTLLFAIITGFLFGFVLQKVGATNPQRIIDMLRLKDFHLLKTILLGIGGSSLLLFIFLGIGLVDASHISIKGAYTGVIVGGLIFGIGWAVAGFCPGTGIAALATGRKDAVFFVLGGLIGAFIFTLSYGAIKDNFLFAALGGNASLASTGNDKFTVLFPDTLALFVAGGIALLLIVIAWKAPEKV